MLRFAGVSDLKAVVRIGRDCKPWLTGITGDWLVDVLADPRKRLVVELSDTTGEVRGFMLVSIEGNHKTVEVVGVAKGWRRNGVAQALLKELGSGPAHTWAHPGNKKSRNLLRKMGWRQITEEGDDVDKVHYALV